MYGDYMQHITERFMQKFISFLFLRPNANGRRTNRLFLYIKMNL